MATKDYHERRTSGKTLDDLYHVATSIDEKVEEIMDELHDMVEYQRDRSYRGFEFDEYH